MCPLCEATCGLELTIEDGRVTRVTGDPQDSFSRGYLCPKGATLGELHHDPDRLEGPLLRDGVGHRRVGWDEALAAVAERLHTVVDRHGPGSVAVYLGNPSTHTGAGQTHLRDFVRSLRTRHVYSASTVDQMPGHVAAGLMYGDPGAIPVPDVDRTDHLVLFGANPRMSNGSLWTAPDLPGRLDALRDRGGRLVVVDPRRSRTAARADEHVAVRPGTDALLLAALCTTLAEEELVDLGAADAHVTGLDRAVGALAAFTPERVADATRVCPATIRRLARELAAADRPAVYGRIGVHAQRFGTVCAWATDLLTTLVGGLDVPGGLMWARPAHEVGRRGRPYETGRWHSRVRGLPEVNGELPVATLADEIETPGEGQVRALVVFAGNPLRSTPNSRRLTAAVEQLDLVVSVDPYVTATSARADVVLPPPGPLHQAHPELTFATFGVRNVTHHSPAVLPRPDDRLEEHEILLALTAIAGGATPPVDLDELDREAARRTARHVAGAEESRLAGADVDQLLALTDHLHGPERIADLLWRAGPYGAGAGEDGMSVATMREHPSGVDHGPLQPRLPDLLVTASGLVELAPDAILADLDRLATTLAEPHDGLVLVGRRHLRTNNSWGQNVPSLTRGATLATLWVHPSDAAANGLAHGTSVSVHSRVGAVDALVEVTEDIAPGTVSLPHGFGNDEQGIRLSVAAEVGGPNSNELTDEEAIDPLSGNAVLNGIPVTLGAA